MLASLALHAGLLLVMACAEAPTDLVEERSRVELARYYLRVQETAVQTDGDGGKDVRVRGEPAGLGPRVRASRLRSTSARRSVQGPAHNPDPHIARQAALRSAAQFGLIGLLSEPAGGDPAAPVDPSGRDDSLGTEPGSGRTSDGADALDSDARDGSLEGAPFVGTDEALPNAEEYSDFGVNPAVDPTRRPLSTFAVDVDTGSYTLVQRKLRASELPPLAAVRTEEIINYFDYGYAGPEPADDRALRVHLEAAPSPFDRGHRLLRVGIQGRRIDPDLRPPLHVTALLDSSGSMEGPDRLGLAQESLKLLVDELRPEDTLAVCTYADTVRVVLPPTSGRAKRTIRQAIDSLAAGGLTAMGSGLELAYQVAASTFGRGHINRVMVLSDGDANVGETSPDAILATIAEQRKRGIQLSTIGLGVGNYKDAMMERLADAGDGNYSYIGSMDDARRLFFQNAAGLLQTIARDAKVQVEFDPAHVASYRLLGYENRDVDDVDFRNDDVDGGEIGAGHSVTALYDIVLRDERGAPVKVHLRYKEADSDVVRESETVLTAEDIAPSFEQASEPFRLATAVAAFAESLRGSPYALYWDLGDVEQILRGLGEPPDGAEQLAEGSDDRTQLVELVAKAIELRKGEAEAAL